MDGRNQSAGVDVIEIPVVPMVRQYQLRPFSQYPDNLSLASGVAATFPSANPSFPGPSPSCLRGLGDLLPPPVRPSRSAQFTARHVPVQVE
jgi:hypothetical protein